MCVWHPREMPRIFPLFDPLCFVVSHVAPVATPSPVLHFLRSPAQLPTVPCPVSSLQSLIPAPSLPACVTRQAFKLGSSPGLITIHFMWLTIYVPVCRVRRFVLSVAFVPYFHKLNWPCQKWKDAAMKFLHSNFSTNIILAESLPHMPREPELQVTVYSRTSIFYTFLSLSRGNRWIIFSFIDLIRNINGTISISSSIPYLVQHF